MPRVRSFSVRIQTGQVGTDTPVRCNFNSHEVELNVISGGTGAGQVFEGEFLPMSFAHTLTIVGPEEGEWEIEGMIYYPEATVQIFNRWGEVIYETQNYYDRPWDGKWKGVDVPVDSYYFIISFTNGNSDITGHVTIIK